MNNEEICVQGKMWSNDENTLLLQNFYLKKKNIVLDKQFIIRKDDIYTEFKVRGYNYTGLFRGLTEFKTNFDEYFGKTEWNGNIVAFLDTIFQSVLITKPIKQTIVPVMLKCARIDPKILLDWIRQNINKKYVYLPINKILANNILMIMKAKPKDFVDSNQILISISMPIQR